MFLFICAMILAQIGCESEKHYRRNDCGKNRYDHRYRNHDDRHKHDHYDDNDCDNHHHYDRR